MRKRITSLLLTLVMLLSLLPAMGVTASAAETGVTVNSFKELQDAIKWRKEYIKLGEDIDTASYNEGIGLLKRDELTFNDTSYSCTLDLNGKTLALVSNDTNISQGIHIGGSHLTIKDGSTANTGKISGAFSNVYGGQDAKLIRLDGGKLTLEGGTFTVTSLPHKANAIVIDSVQGFVTIKNGVKISQPEFNDLGYGRDLDGSGYTLQAENSSYGGGRVIIEGGEFDGCVKLTGSQAENGSVQISGGTFKKDVQVLYEADENNSNPAVTVSGGTFEGNVYLQGWDWKTSLYMPYRLNGGTFKGKLNLHADYTITTYDKPEGNPNIALGLDKCFGYSAVVAPDGTFAGPNAKTVVLKKTTEWDYEMLLNGSASDPIQIIPNAWGIKSVKLDGKEIDYAKNWNGSVQNLDNSTAHTLKFEWYPLAQELKDAGYTYRANFDCYTVGSNTPTTSVPISATATEYSHTIPAGAAPSVYPFDLQLNLEKNGSFVGIIVNQHIVRISLLNGISSSHVRFSDVVTVDKAPPTANAAGSGYTVNSIGWFTDSGCSTQANAFTVGTPYYAKVVLKSSENHMFVNGKNQGYPVVIPFCDGNNDNYSIVGRPTISDSGKTLTFVVQSTAIGPFVWESVDTANVTHTIGSTGVELHAKAVGGDVSQYRDITYKLYTQKNGETTVAKSAKTQGEFTPVFRPAEVGVYRCWFEATRGFDTITSTPFTVTVSTPGLSITNQSGDFTIMQGGYARLFVIAKNASNYQWQVTNGGSWTNLPGETDHDYRAKPAEIGKHIYRCKLTNRYGDVAYSNEMTVTVLENETQGRTPVYILPAINEAAPNPAELWPGKVIDSFNLQKQTSKNAEYTVTAGSYFQAEAFYSVIPGGEGYKLKLLSGTLQDLYYNSYEEKQYTAVMGEITYKWEATSEVDQWGYPTKFAEIGTGPSMKIPIPEGVGTYWAKLTITNTIGTGSNAKSQNGCVEITFHVDQPGVTVSGKLTSYNGKKDCTVTLYTAGTTSAVKSVTVKGNNASNQATQDFTLSGVAPGTYDLVVTKDAHLTYTVKNVKVGDTDLDLTKHSNAAIRTITLLAGDVNGNGIINEDDLNTIWLSANYLKNADDSGVNALADVNGDGIINEDDLNIVWLPENYLKSTSDCEVIY